MLDVLHYSSRALKRISIACLAATVLSGCSMTTSDNSQGFFQKLKKEPSIDSLISGSTTSPEKAVKKKAAKTIRTVSEKQKAATVQPFEIKTSALSDTQSYQESAACRYMRSNADSEAIIVGSPTLSASTDEDGSGSVSIGMNLLDFKKAELIRASGDAKCRLHNSSKQVEAALGLGAEATKFVSFYAKQDYIRQHLGKLNGIRAKANSLVQQGAITRQDANQISQLVSNMKSKMAKAKAEADQRSELPAVEASSVRHGHGALLEATRDLQQIERDIRTNDALELSVSAGYRYNDTFNDQTQQTDAEGSFARVSIGVRLGALSAQRQLFEEEAASARLDALTEENTGAIWKSGFSDRAITRMLKSLQTSEQQLSKAIAHTDDTIGKLRDESSPEVIRARMMAEIQRISAGSERAAIRAAIKQLESNQDNIQALAE